MSPLDVLNIQLNIPPARLVGTGSEKDSPASIVLVIFDLVLRVGLGGANSEGGTPGRRASPLGRGRSGRRSRSSARLVRVTSLAAAARRGHARQLFIVRRARDGVGGGRLPRGSAMGGSAEASDSSTSASLPATQRLDARRRRVLGG